MFVQFAGKLDTIDHRIHILTKRVRSLAEIVEINIRSVTRIARPQPDLPTRVCRARLKNRPREPIMESFKLRRVTGKVSLEIPRQTEDIQIGLGQFGLRPLDDPDESAVGCVNAVTALPLVEGRIVGAARGRRSECRSPQKAKRPQERGRYAYF